MSMTHSTPDLTEAARDRVSLSETTTEQHSPRHDARALTKGGRAAEIALDGKTYTLRITRAGKLILTK